MNLATSLYSPGSLRVPASAIELATLCVGAASAFGSAAAQEAPVQVADANAKTITVTGEKQDRDSTGLDKLTRPILDTPASIDQITQQAIQEQGTTRLQDALRYAPGITLNSGEGGAHGDNVNLRGSASIDGFFLDGIRDPGAYTRDNFNIESIAVMEGPSSILFGNGSAGGVVNVGSKLPGLAPIKAATLEFGTNGEFRGTADVNQPLDDGIGLRLTAMGETAGVADRDQVQNRRWGFAPSVTFGLGGPTQLTLAYFVQSENNVPDYGIPFLNGEPAPVPRNLWYGLKNVDVSQTDVNVLTATIRHQFDASLSITDTLRYGNYWSNYRVSAPHLGNDYIDPQPPGTPLDQIVIYRDRPSSEGTQTYLTNHTDLTARFDTGSVSQTLVTGIEVGRQTTDYVRFDNDFQGIDGTPPTSLLHPDPNTPAPAQTLIDSRPSTTADMIGVYGIDTVALSPQWDLDLGLRWDRYVTSFNDPLNVGSFERTDAAWSPKAALVFKPTKDTSVYASYAKSFDPAVSFLTLAPDSHGPAPETATAYEVGAKAKALDGLVLGTIALFRTDTANILLADPDDPTLQEMPGSRQRIQGIEATITGHLTESWEIDANLTLLDPKITASSTPGEVGRLIPGATRVSANLWSVYDVTDEWQIGAGANYLGHRYADSLNTANIPSYVVFNAMTSYEITDDIKVQANLDNLTDKRYYDGAYYSDATESHIIPGAGRTLVVSTNFRF
jgi:catecholate siderophore receptor